MLQAVVLVLVLVVYSRRGTPRGGGTAGSGTCPVRVPSRRLRSGPQVDRGSGT